MELYSQKAHWDVLKEKLRKKYPQLTDTDFHHEAGMEENMRRMIEYKLSKTRQEFKEIIGGL